MSLTYHFIDQPATLEHRESFNWAAEPVIFSWNDGVAERLCAAMICVNRNLWRADTRSVTCKKDMDKKWLKAFLWFIAKMSTAVVKMAFYIFREHVE